MVYFVACPKHPNNKRPGLRGQSAFTVPFGRAAQGGSIGIDRGALDTPGRKGPLAV